MVAEMERAPDATATQAFLQAVPPDSCGPASSATGEAGERGRFSGAVRQTIELPRTQEPGSGLGGAWRVIVRNDDHNTFDHVATRSRATSRA